MDVKFAQVIEKICLRNHILKYFFSFDWLDIFLQCSFETYFAFVFNVRSSSKILVKILKFSIYLLITGQKLKFSIKEKLRIWSHLLKKSLMENFIFCVMCEQSEDNFLTCKQRDLSKRVVANVHRPSHIMNIG